MTEVLFSAEFWDERYRLKDQIWSGEPNPVLVEVATDLAPGTALDVGCGEGADAIWLAAHGERLALHHRLAAVVRPGGTLLVVGHHPSDLDTSMQRPDLPALMVTADQLAEALDPAGWQISTSTREREVVDPDGATVTIADAVPVAVRRS